MAEANDTPLVLRWAAAIFVGLFGGFLAGLTAFLAVALPTNNTTAAALVAVPAAVAAAIAIGIVIVGSLRGVAPQIPVTAMFADGAASPESAAVSDNPYAPPTKVEALTGARAEWPTSKKARRFVTPGAKPRRIVFHRKSFYIGGDDEPLALVFDREAFVQTWSVRNHINGRTVLAIGRGARVPAVVLPPDASTELLRWLGPRRPALLRTSVRLPWIPFLCLGILAVALFIRPRLIHGTQLVGIAAFVAIAAGGLLGRFAPRPWVLLLQAAGWLGLAAAIFYAAAASRDVISLFCGVAMLFSALQAASVYYFFVRRAPGG
jgi:hypothetical protein